MPVGGSFIQERWCWSKIIVWKNSRWRRYLLLSYNHSLQSFIGGLSNSNDANFPALDIWWNNALRDTAGKITAIPFVTCLPGKRHPSRESYPHSIKVALRIGGTSQSDYGGFQFAPHSLYTAACAPLFLAILTCYPDKHIFPLWTTFSAKAIWTTPWPAGNTLWGTLVYFSIANTHPLPP